MFRRLTLLFFIRASLQQCNEVETTVDFYTSPEYYNSVEPNLTGCTDDGSMCTGGILNDADIGPITDIDTTDPNHIRRFYAWQVDSISQVFLRYHSTGRQPFNFSYVNIYALVDSLAGIGIPMAPTVTAYEFDTSVRATMVDTCSYTASDITIIKMTLMLPSTIEVRRVDIHFRNLGVRWLFISEIELCQGTPESSLTCVAPTSVSTTVNLMVTNTTVPMSTYSAMLRMPQPSSTAAQDQTTDDMPKTSISFSEAMVVTSSVPSYTFQPAPTLILSPSITLLSPPPTGLTITPDFNQPNSVSLSCSVTNDKYQYHWHWWKNGQLLSNNNKFAITNTTNTQSTTLLISSLQYSDAGDYVCRVVCSNDAHHKEAIGNIILSLPVVVIVNEPEYRECGSHVAMMCEVFGYPRNSFLPVWTFGELIIQNDDRHTVTVTRSDLLRDNSVSMEQRVKSQLMIKNISKNDAGIYKCSVEGNSTSGAIIHSNIAQSEAAATDSNNMGYDCDALIGTGIVLALASVVSIATNVLMAVCVYHNIKKNLKNNSLIEKSKSSMGSNNMPVQDDTYQYIMDEGDIMIHTQNQAYGQCGGMQEMKSYQRSSTTSSYYY